jgi:hypothetical protein
MSLTLLLDKINVLVEWTLLEDEVVFRVVHSELLVVYPKECKKDVPNLIVLFF